ncbi:MAG: hypothetical protein M0Q21_07670 [Ignavibacteriaceae bacterium]|nr:hypothetical protein [Ignavibacteriaceae bacterium]
MNIDSTLYEEDEYLLFRLRYFLNIELSTSLIYIFVLLNLFALFLAAISAIVFSPYLFYVLYKTKKYGWISLLIIIVFIPAITFLSLNYDSFYKTIFLFIVLGIFYIYCFVLRFVVIDWCEEIKGKWLLNEQRKQKAEKDMLDQKYFGNR